jgi:hypothetical protein
LIDLLADLKVLHDILVYVLTDGNGASSTARSGAFSREQRCLPEWSNNPNLLTT